MRSFYYCLLFAITSMAAACDEGGDSVSPTVPALLDLTTARVTDVIDGDTIRVEIDGIEYAVRYIGVDTPEVANRGEPADCFGPEAAAYNETLVGGKTVGLDRDVSETDDFGRFLRYVFVGARMVNAMLVDDGYAYAKSYPPDTEFDDAFQDLEADARAEMRGLWGAVCASEAETPAAPTATPPLTTGQAGACDYSGTNEAVIKGNISQDDGDRIYHTPGQADYANTRINEPAGELWFCTEAQAVAAGWRKALR